MFHAEGLARWYIIFPRAAKDETDKFLQAMQKVAQGLKYDIKAPRR